MDAWNMMEGQIDWAALDVVTAVLGIEDPEQFLEDLFVVRKHVGDLREAQKNARS